MLKLFTSGLKRKTKLQDLYNVYDYIIVGGGTAGCVLANRLSENRQKTVLLVEAGGSDDLFWIRIPIGYLKGFGNPLTDWCFETLEDPGISNRKLSYTRGRILGGCTTINGMIAMRG